MPSARLMSLAWNATKCSANEPGPIGEDLPGNCCVYCEVVRMGLVAGQLPKQIPFKVFVKKNVSVETVKHSQVSLTKALNLSLLPVG